jgi:carboxypeptidase C (cathepsin A)
MDAILVGFDPYALDFDKCLDGQSVAGRHERWMLRRAILQANSVHHGKTKQLEAMPPYEPCVEEFMTAYLNRADVQAAIHVKAGTIQWKMCSDDVGSAYNMTDVNSPMMPVWKELIKLGDLNILILSGDDDAICATLGTQQFIWDLGYPPKDGKNWQPWKVKGQVAGFHTQFEVPSHNNLGAFGFATVHSAGHMVPATQPEKSLALLQLYLAKDTKKQNALMV